MSAAGGQGPDLSRIVSLIMQNPELIRQIEALARQDAAQGTEAPEVTPKAEAEETEGSVPCAAMAERMQRREKRTQLLTALRPYVSEKRGKTLDTLIGMVDLFDLMGRG